jgi:hypothetical protein
MGARKVVYADFEGGLVYPWSKKPFGHEPVITIWADGKVQDNILISENAKTGSSYKRRLSRKRVAEYELAAQQNANDLARFQNG